MQIIAHPIMKAWDLLFFSFPSFCCCWICQSVVMCSYLDYMIGCGGLASHPFILFYARPCCSSKCDRSGTALVSLCAFLSPWPIRNFNIEETY
ncbi:hypothetical protein F4810DRAFT_695215 [Camillea tinctor]|nr:hypothetical protein F4810DRAFT_695215 [Camillea tinctor]